MSSVFSSASSSSTNLAEGRLQATTMEENAKLALMQAMEKASTVRTGTDYLLSQQRLLYSKGGVDITSGSPLLTMKNTAYQGELAARDIESKGRLQYRFNRLGASWIRKAANMQMVSGTIGTVMNALTSAAGGVAGGIGTGSWAGGLQGALNPSAGFGSYINSLKKPKTG